MIITRGLGGGLLVTRGYGVPALLVHPYCPDGKVHAQVPTFAQVLVSPFIKAADVVDINVPNFTKAASPYATTASVIDDAAANEVVVDPTIQDDTDVISSTPKKHTQLPKKCN